METPRVESAYRNQLRPVGVLRCIKGSAGLAGTPWKRWTSWNIKKNQLEHQREPAGTSMGTSRNRSLEEAVGSSRTSWSDKLNQLERYEPAGSAKEKVDQLMR
ncbi:hypothetical protein F511_46764 [Dorcoceras hygrometricum]|uniref:Uncharacterized protein n=1 Tax=Dorcoceras hygrometricum TaxID=472368 RepID=A0A2Z6ZSR6_9LAMI|nr:hypothetical protein F511_46764 [Dorcoceras hygrometricum]